MYEASNIQLLYGLLLLLIISVMINLYFFSNRLSASSIKKRFKKTLPLEIKKYLSSQEEASKDFSRHLQRKHLNKKAMRLRQAYLCIESKAVDQGIDSLEYWNLINAKLLLLLDVLVPAKAKVCAKQIREKITKIKELVSKSGKSKFANKAIESLSNFEQACLDDASDEVKLLSHSKKVDALLEKLENAMQRRIENSSDIHKSYSITSHKMLKQLRGAIEEGEKKVDEIEEHGAPPIDVSSLQENNKKMRDAVNKCRHQVYKIQENNEKVDAGVISYSDDGSEQSSQDDLYDLSEQIQKESEKEIDRLKGVVRDQHNVILELEESLGSVQSEVAPGEVELFDSNTKPTNEGLGGLKASLKDAENCISTLEKELLTLRKKLSKQKELSNEEVLAEPLSENSLKTLEQSVSVLEKEVAGHKQAEERSSLMMTYVMECLDAGSIEDVSLSIYQILADLGWKVGLIVKGDGRSLEIDPESCLNNKEKTLIKNMQIDEIDSSHAKNVIKFRHVNIAGKLQESNDGGADAKEVLRLIKASDKILEKMKSGQGLKKEKKRVEEGANLVKRLAHEVDTSIEKMCTRTEQELTSSFGQIQDLARAKGLSASQIASFKSLEQQAISVVKAENTERLKVKKKFLGVLNKLES
ncbi:hypothetical protein [Agaribacterium sp. ZY112]|uniref:hypothetical protein n=1 Tax=Agaribacterium sp. ZY112 TaxID=3233574 RepID=UPI0035236EBB